MLEQIRECSGNLAGHTEMGALQHEPYPIQRINGYDHYVQTKHEGGQEIFVGLLYL